MDARAAPPSTASATPVVTTRDRNSSSGTSGSAARRSTMTNAVISRAATARLQMTVGAAQPPSAAAPRAPWTRAMIAPVSDAAPQASKGRRGPPGVGGYDTANENDRKQRDRHGDEKNRTPTEAACEKAAGDDTRCPAERRGGGPRAHRPGSRLAREADQQQGHCGRAEPRSTDTLQDPPRDQQRLATRGRGHYGAHGEHCRASDEHAPSSPQVRCTSREQEETPVGQDVGVHDHAAPTGPSPRSVWMDGNATLTIEMSSITTNWAQMSRPRAGHRRRAEG